MANHSLLCRIRNWDSHHRLGFAVLGSALIAALLALARVSLPVGLAAIWDAFCVCALAPAWLRIISARPRESLRTARLQDSSRALIFLFVLLGAVASIFAVCNLLGSARGRHGELLAETIALAFGTLLGSWTLIHTLFALRYAHLYYGDAPGSARASSHRGGLEFPGEQEPDYLDFAYFSFVIGMTCQVSDVQITARPLRRLALAHGVLSFGFNTVILAISINIASGLFT